MEMTLHSEGQLLTAQQACAELFVGHEAHVKKNLYKLYRMIDRGEIEGGKIGSLWHVPRSEIDRFMGVRHVDTG